jgi:hypothetical protein
MRPADTPTPKGGETRTIVVENARLELLRGLAAAEDHHQARINDPAEEHPEFWPTHYPLFCGEWANAASDIILAAEESAKLGHIELHKTTFPLMERMVRITPAGYAWIRAHDAIGEAAQEAAHV